MCRCYSLTDLIQWAAFIATVRVTAAGLTILARSSIRTLVSTSQGQKSPAEHNPQLHLHGAKAQTRLPLKVKTVSIFTWKTEVLIHSVAEMHHFLL